MSNADPNKVLPPKSKVDRALARLLSAAEAAIAAGRKAEKARNDLFRLFGGKKKGGRNAE